jgi:hypothetical protein
MPSHKRRQTFENIVRLRNAEGRFADPGIAVVREDLESQLGGTVPRSLAARRLGVSHTTLNKWISSGDVPVVITKQGRKEVPIPALLELSERVAEKRRSGGDRAHALEAVMIEEHRRADQLHLQLEPLVSAEPHRVAELRSLAYHRALAPRLGKPTVDQARRRLRRWQDEERIDPRYADAWREVLAQPIGKIREAIAVDDERGRALRQSSPFAGMLGEQERRKLLALS